MATQSLPSFYSPSPQVEGGLLKLGVLEPRSTSVPAVIIRELPGNARGNTAQGMVVGLLITGCIGVLAVGATFAAIIYYDARSGKRQ